MLFENIILMFFRLN